MNSTSDKKSARRRSGRAFGPPDRLCLFCIHHMPPAETVEACKTCHVAAMRLNKLLNQIAIHYPETRKMTREEIFERLWAFVKEHRGL